ncbi:hypothetical protein LTR56_019639 [Elasticomyces elasticus]|nr:hypothetical protein LTR56_019639 [Elasticomyces elasticus]KAK3662330.1 hypothetical protein LTR22_006863 [Elasticomyces elasticus]KAK4924731.1 hypothetical protein LTR49_008180 [Elasticomyces elasticus]KAK5766863.1 hypothetical protein LTS12_002939 [Elasticomyces elasticus]
MQPEVKTTRDIKIIVGDKTPQTFFVQQQLLESTSDYFVKALRNQHLGEKPEPGVLRFPEDRVSPWRLLLFWMYKHELPADVYHHDLIPAVRAWALGDRLCIPELQNHIMLVLIWSFKDENPGFALIKVAVQSSLADSPMRKLMAEEIVADESNPPSKEELEELDGCHFLAQLMELQREGAKESYDRGLDEDGNIEDFDELNEYMVGNGLAEPDTEAKILRGTEFDEASSA